MSTQLRRSVRAFELAAALGRELEGDDVAIRCVAASTAAAEGALTFMTRPNTVTAGRGVTVLSAERPPGATWIRSARPRLDFAKALGWLHENAGFERPDFEPEVHPSVRMGSGVSLGRGVVIGEGTVIGHNVRISDGVRIGRDCHVKSGAVLGEDGFGFERDTDGTPIRILHLGGVAIGDRVEIGSLTTVCQGTLVPTVIEDDAKIDDHVHIAHNVRVKRKALVIACAEVSGGAVIGEESWIAPNASILEGVTIGDRAIVGLGAVVLRNVPSGSTVVGNPARPLVKKGA